MPESDETTVNENTGADEAIRIAMARERKAREFYLRCAGIVKDPGVRKMFEFLAKEEGRHLELLEKEHDRFIVPEN